MIVLNELRDGLRIIALLQVILCRHEVAVAVACATAVVYHLVTGHHDGRLLLQQLLLGGWLAGALRRSAGHWNEVPLVLLERLEMLEQHFVNCPSLLFLHGSLRKLLHEQVDKVLVGIKLRLYILPILMHLDDLVLQLLNIVILIFHDVLQLV